MNESLRDKAINTENKLKKKLYSRMPGYVFSNDMFEDLIKESLNKDSVWIDAGCGNNSLVYEFQDLAPNGIGIDEVVHPQILTPMEKFIQTSLNKIPLEDSSVDLITANMVVEHLTDIKGVLKEFYRLLKPGGKFIFRTTNKYYPTLFIGNLFPKKLKDKIIYRIFGVRSHDIFPTTYPANTLGRINNIFPSGGFKIDRLEAVEDLHMFNPVAFEISYILYKIQKLDPFKRTRNCIVCCVSKM